MKETRIKNLAIPLMLLILALSLGVVGCGGSDSTPISAPEPTPTLLPTVSPPSATEVIPTVSEEPGNVVITIGNLSDMTGVASGALNIVTMVLEDVVRYYNDQNLIPGVTFEVITYDGGYDPNMDLPGYEYLKEKGVDIIFTPIASAAATLKPYLSEDQIGLFTVVPTQEALTPSGYVFCAGNTSARYASYTILKWIADNDPDFPKDRPARIGGAYWIEAYAEELLTGAEEYANTHSDQYEWVGGYLTDFTFTWATEIEALKDCDYVFPPVPVNKFATEYREMGYNGKFVGTDAHFAFLSMIDEADLWDALDGMLFAKPGRWWNEDDEIVNLAKTLLQEYHPGEAEEIASSGSGYLTIQPIRVMLNLVRDAVAAVGPDKFSSQAVYDAAESFSLMVDDIELHSFSETKRVSSNYLGIYELRATGEDIFRISPEWYPVISEP